MAQAPYDEVKARIEALKAQGRPVADLDAAVTAGGWTPEAFKAQAKPAPAAAVPFDKVKATVEDLKRQGRPVAELDAAVTASGMTPDEYKAQAKAKAAPVGSGGPLGGGAIEAGARGFLDAATFGGADELGGMIEGVQSLLKGGEYGKAYDEAVARRRKGNEAFATAYPKTTFGGEVAGGLMSAPLMPGVGVGGTIARGVEQGAVGGAAYGLGSGDDGLLSRLKGAAEGLVTGGVTGGVLGTAGKAIGTALGRGAGPKIVDATGNLTPEAQAMLKTQGLDPNAVDVPLARQAALELAGGGTGRARQADPVSVAATVRRLIAERHGVGLTTPEATRDIGQIAKVQEALAGTRGAPAMHEAQAASVAGQDQFAQAAGNLAQKAAPGGVGGYGESGTGALLAKGVNDRADAAWQGVKQLYRQTGTDQHMVTSAETKGLLPTIKAKLDAAKLSGITEGVPGFTNAMQTLKRSVVDNNLSFADADEIRKVLGQLSRNAADKTDRYKIDTTIKGFDDWLDGVAGSRASTLPGDSLAALRQARAGAKDWFKTFQRDPRNPGDAAGKAIEQIRQGNLDHQKLFDVLMGSRGGFDEGGLAVSRRVRDIVGDQSPEWQTLQQGMVRRVLFGDANKQAIDFQPGEQAWKTMDTRISQALGEGRGARLAEDVLGPDATTRLREMREIARAKAIPAKAANPSGSGHVVSRMLGAAMGKAGVTSAAGAGAYLGSMTGTGPVGALVGAGLGGGAAAAGGVMRDQLQARELRRLLGSYRAPKAGPGIDLPPLSAFGAGGLSDWLYDREKR